MKYLLIFLFSFAIFNPTVAARQVTGTVPQVQPLQPPPLGVYANPSGNIQFNDSSHQGQFDAEGNVVGEPGNQAQSLNPQDQQSFGQGQMLANSNHPWFWSLGLIILLVLGAAAFGINQWRKNGK